MLKKNKKALEMMDALDERFLEEAETACFRPRLAKRVMAIAASLALAVGIVTMAFGDFGGSDPVLPPTFAPEQELYVWDKACGLFVLRSDAISATTTSSGAGNAASNDGRTHQEIYYPYGTSTDTDVKLTHYSLYPYATGCYETYVRLQGVGVSLTHVGDFISDVSMADEEGNTVDASLYAIKDVDPACAVCVEYGDGKGSYVLYINPDVRFESFAAFREAYSLEEQLYVGGGIMVKYSYADKSETLQQMHPVTDTVKYRILQADGPSLTYEAFAQRCESLEGIGINASHGRLIRFPSQGIRVFRDGYLMTNIGGALRFFEIGEASAQSIIEAATRVAGEDGQIVIYDADAPFFEEPPETEPVGSPELGTETERPETTAAAPYRPTETSTAKPPHRPTETVPSTSDAVRPIVPGGTVEETTERVYVMPAAETTRVG